MAMRVHKNVPRSICGSNSSERDAGGKFRNSLGNPAGDTGLFHEGARTGPPVIRYLREPRLTFFRRVCRNLAGFRFGLVMIKVPLPMYSDL